MSKLKKLGSMLLALVFAIGMTCTALAADTYTISLAEGTTGYTYAVYQILTGDVSDKTLSNVAWGTSMTEAAETALETEYGATGAAAVAEAIATANDAQALAETLADYTSGMTAIGTLSDTTTSLTVAGGYYLIVNTAISGDVTTYSNYIVEVVGNTTISPKGDYEPTFDKTVGDETASDDATEDYAVGDSVPFTLTATLPDDYADFTTYTLTFTDTLSSGLTYNNDAKVTVDGADITDSCNITTNGQTITVTITDLKTVASAAAKGSKVVVSYSATLDDGAASVESNKATLTYSNNPNDSSTFTTTPEDKTYVVTFTVNVNKVDEDGTTALKGAAFTLYTQDENGDYTVVVGTSTAGEATSFSFDGLAIGNYQLVETTTPDGYNTADPIEFTIAASAVEYATKAAGVDVTITSPTVSDGFEISAESLSTTVINNKGSSLPTTGGMGTTIFYIVGGVLAAGAVVLLITKKRMSE